MESNVLLRKTKLLREASMGPRHLCHGIAVNLQPTEKPNDIASMGPRHLCHGIVYATVTLRKCS
ncbi:MAG: hypothetical protein OJF51_000165 [Nitrospira sp.]|nr:MAG: hypothetical protein OJF51_000165 [Nitrospira sp.]